MDEFFVNIFLNDVFFVSMIKYLLFNIYNSQVTLMLVIENEAIEYERSIDLVW